MCGHCDQCDRAGLSGAANQSECLPYGTYLGILRKSLEAPITEEDIVKIATSICGLFKDVEERVYRVYLNKSDILKEKEPAEHIVEELERKNTVAAYGSLLEE